MSDLSRFNERFDEQRQTLDNYAQEWTFFSNTHDTNDVLLPKRSSVSTCIGLGTEPPNPLVVEHVDHHKAF